MLKPHEEITNDITDENGHREIELRSLASLNEEESEFKLLPMAQYKPDGGLIPGESQEEKGDRPKYRVEEHEIDEICSSVEELVKTGIDICHERLINENDRRDELYLHFSQTDAGNRLIHQMIDIIEMKYKAYADEEENESRTILKWHIDKWYP